MNLSALIEEDKLIRAKYDYYRSLGYTDYAAAVFSTVAYGYNDLASFVQKLTPDKTRTISDLAAWLKDRPETHPENAFSNYAIENRPQSAVEEGREILATPTAAPSPRISRKANPTSAARSVEACMAPPVAYERRKSPSERFSLDRSYAAPLQVPALLRCVPWRKHCQPTPMRPLRRNRQKASSPLLLRLSG